MNQHVGDFGKACEQQCLPHSLDWPNIFNLSKIFGAFIENFTSQKMLENANRWSAFNATPFSVRLRRKENFCSEKLLRLFFFLI